MRILLALFLTTLAAACAATADQRKNAKVPPPPTALAPCIWFEYQAEEAIEFYASVLDGAEIVSVLRAREDGPMPKGAFLAGRLALRGSEIMVLNGNPQPSFSHTNSIVLSCRNQEELDSAWSALTKGGSEIDCGWLQDKYGVVWQIVPDSLERMLADPDPEKAKRAMAAMLSMRKFDFAALERAYAGR